jgi:hypothetical protein
MVNHVASHCLVHAYISLFSTPQCLYLFDTLMPQTLILLEPKRRGGSLGLFYCLKGLSRDFRLVVFYHESVSPKHLSIPLRPFQIFSKTRGDIRGSRCTTGVNDTGGKWKKSSSRKILIILFGHLWVVELTYI